MHPVARRGVRRFCGARVSAHLAGAMVFACMAFGFRTIGLSWGGILRRFINEGTEPGPDPRAEPQPHLDRRTGPSGHRTSASSVARTGTVAQQIASGGMVGYVRAFIHDPPNGQAVVIEGDWVRDQSNIPAILAGIEGGAKGPRFNVPGIVDAIGFETTSADTTEPSTPLRFREETTSSLRWRNRQTGPSARARPYPSPRRRPQQSPVPQCRAALGVEQLQHLLQGWTDLWRSRPGGSDHRWTGHRHSKECPRQKDSGAAAIGIG